MKRYLLALLLAAASTLCAAQILGKKPEYLSGAASDFANAEAIERRIWWPRLDEGWVPQGLAVVEGDVFVSGYRSADRNVSTGPCRVFRVDAKTGEEKGFFDMPPECTHSGGLAYVGGGLLVVSDTRQLWCIDTRKALAAGKADGAIKGTLRLGGNLYGSFASFDGTDLWIGRYVTRAEPGNAKLHRLPLKLFEEKNGATIDESHVAETLPAPPLGQGMAFQGRDTIWIAASSSQLGWFHKLERATGREVAKYDGVIGLEGIGFDDQGKLWVASEAGAKKWLHWKQHFPIIFLLDPDKLK